METLMLTFGNMVTSPGPENLPSIFVGCPHSDDEASLNKHQLIQCATCGLHERELDKKMKRKPNKKKCKETHKVGDDPKKPQTRELTNSHHTGQKHVTKKI